MKKAVMTVMAVLVALVWFGTQSVQSAPVLDQSQTLGGSTFAVYDDGAGNRESLAQTFTAGITGNLVGVSLWIAPVPTSSLTVSSTISILGTTSGVPNSTVLWTGTFTNLSPGGWFNVDTSTGAPVVTSGQIYAIRLNVLSPLPATDDYWFAKSDQTSEPYSGGQLFESINGGTSWTQLTVTFPGPVTYGYDAAFTTSVDVVPEPTTASLMILALSLVVFVTFRRRPAS